MKPKNSLKLIGPMFCILFLLQCTEFIPTNPKDENFVGDYKLQVNWIPFENEKDKGFFQTYEIGYEDVGKDKFEKCMVTHPPESIVESFVTDTDIKLYFKKPYEGTIIVSGIRPNEKVVHDSSAHVLIENLFYLSGDTLNGLNETIAMRVKHKKNQSFKPFLKTKWEMKGEEPKVVFWDENAPYTTPTMGKFNLKASLRDDSLNVLCEIGDVLIYVVGHRPKIDTAYCNTAPTLGDTLKYTIKMDDTHEDQLKVFIQAKDKDLFESSTFIPFKKLIPIEVTKPMIDTGSINVSVTVLYENGLSATRIFTDSVTYELPEPQFSFNECTIPSNDTVSIVAVDLHHKPGTNYRWKIKHLGIEEVQSSTEFAVYYTKPCSDTIKLTGEYYGYSGKTDTVIVTVESLDYWLKPDVFPAWVDVGNKEQWRVHVVDKNGDEVSEKVAFRWQKSNDTLIMEEDSNVCYITIAGPIQPFTLSVVATIDGKETPPLEQRVYCKAFKPIVSFEYPEYSGVINKPLSCTVNAKDVNQGGFIKKIYWKLDDTGVETTEGIDSIWTKTFKKPRKYTLFAWVEDDDGFLSDTVSVPIFINSDKPVLQDLIYSGNIFYKTPIDLELKTHTSNTAGKVTEWSWDFNNDIALWDTTTDTNFCTISFSKPGEIFFAAQCKDEHNQYSLVFKDTFVVKPGYPIVSKITVDTANDSIFIHDKRKFSVTFSDQNPNGTIEWLFFEVLTKDYKDSIENPPSPGDFFFSFPSPKDQGSHIVKIWAMDDHGFTTTQEKTIYVRLGKPFITDCKADKEHLFLNDSITFAVESHDTNGYVKGYLISWNDNNFQFLTDSIFAGYFSIHGMQKLNVIAMDDDSVLSDTAKFTYMISKGEPHINGIRIVNNEKDIFINDKQTIIVNATDPNDTITTIYISYDGSTNPGKTITNTQPGPIEVSFTHHYTIKDVGPRHLIAWARDNDNLVSPYYDTVITVRLGKPKLTGDKGDTLWVVIDKGPNIEYPIRANSSDENGTIEKHFWSESEHDTAAVNCKKTGQNPLLDRLISINDIHRSFPMWIAIFDDDGIFDSSTFDVFADSIPRKPSVTHDQISSTRIKIAWSGKDYLDQNKTLYKILCDKNKPPKKVISDFKPGNKYDPDTNEDFSFIFRPQEGTGRYYYQVVAKDARGSLNQSDGEDFFNF